MIRIAIPVVALLVAGGVAFLVARGGDDEPRAAAVRVAFPSARAPQTPAEVWAVGDGAAGTRVAARLARRIVRADPDRVLYLGDVYETGSPAEFKTRFASIYRPLLKRMAPTPGNHEWAEHRRGYDPFWHSVTGVATPSYYAFDVGGWHVISLNSETPDDPKQLDWLRRRIAAHGSGTCTIAFWHRPRFSAGTHGDQGDVAPLWDALRGHARLVLGGHDHDLQRMRRVDGITQLVSGAGGRGRYAVRRDRRLAFSDDRHFGALRLRLSPGLARVAFVSTRGHVLDRSVARCTP